MYVLPHHYISHVKIFLVDNLSADEKPKREMAQFLRFNIKNCTYYIVCGLIAADSLGLGIFVKILYNTKFGHKAKIKSV